MKTTLRIPAQKCVICGAYNAHYYCHCGATHPDCFRDVNGWFYCKTCYKRTPAADILLGLIVVMIWLLTIFY